MIDQKTACRGVEDLENMAMLAHSLSDLNRSSAAVVISGMVEVWDSEAGYLIGYIDMNSEEPSIVIPVD